MMVHQPAVFRKGLITNLACIIMIIFHVFFHFNLLGEVMVTVLALYNMSGLHVISQFIGCFEDGLTFTAREGVTGLHMIIKIILGLKNLCITQGALNRVIFINMSIKLTLCFQLDFTLITFKPVVSFSVHIQLMFVFCFKITVFTLQ